VGGSEGGKPSSDCTASRAACTEYSTVYTTSSGISQYWPTTASRAVPSGITGGRSPRARGMNWLVV
jgi:hypothetical protein